MFAYGAGISVFSPIASLYQLLRLHPQVQVPKKEMVMLAARIFPVQTLLKATQMNASTPVKEHISPWVAFGVIGVLQGGVYGQANVYFSQKLQIAKKVDMKGMFRGVLFAGVRDSISQGVPFLFSSVVREKIAEPAIGKNAVSQWGSVISTSVVATYISQGLHNAQILMQADHSLSYQSTVKMLWERNGMSLFYRGAEARVGLLLVVNVLNELLLKPAWSKVPVEEVEK